MKKIFALLMLAFCLASASFSQSLYYQAPSGGNYHQILQTYSAPGKNLSIQVSAACINSNGSTGGAVVSPVDSYVSISGVSAAVATYNGALSASSTATIIGLSNRYQMVVWGAYSGWGRATVTVY